MLHLHSENAGLDGVECEIAVGLRDFFARQTGGFGDQSHFGAGYGCSSRVDHGAGNGTGHGLGI